MRFRNYSDTCGQGLIQTKPASYRTFDIMNNLKCQDGKTQNVSGITPQPVSRVYQQPFIS